VRERIGLARAQQRHPIVAVFGEESSQSSKRPSSSRAASAATKSSGATICAGPRRRRHELRPRAELVAHEPLAGRPLVVTKTRTLGLRPAVVAVQLIQSFAARASRAGCFQRDARPSCATTDIGERPAVVASSRVRRDVRAHRQRENSMPPPASYPRQRAITRIALGGTFEASEAGSRIAYLRRPLQDCRAPFGAVRCRIDSS
jgi:hypothetical protein